MANRVTANFWSPVITSGFCRLRRHFLRNLLGHPSLQKEQKIGDGPLPSAARVRPASATAHYSASLRSARRLPQMTLRPVGCLMFCLRLRYRSDSDKTSGPRATRGSSHSLRFLCSFIEVFSESITENLRLRKSIRNALVKYVFRAELSEDRSAYLVKCPHPSDRGGRWHIFKEVSLPIVNLFILKTLGI